MLEILEQKLLKAERHAAAEKRRYWTIRRKVIKYLGGGCCICGDFIETNLEIHHVHPVLSSPKGRVRENRNGGARMRDMRLILEGKLKAELYCKRCHKEHAHTPGTPMDTTIMRENKRRGDVHG